MVNRHALTQVGAGLLAFCSMVALCPAQWSQERLSVARADHVGTESNGQIYFAGGDTGSAVLTSSVEVYDLTSGTWSTMALSTPRFRLAAAACDGIVAFAGGRRQVWGEVTDIIDLYDESADTWSVTSLPQAASIFAGVGVGGRLIFNRGSRESGKGFLSVAQIHDLATQRWFTVDLQTGQSWTAAETDGRLAFLVDGGSPWAPSPPLVDIYDSSTGLWARTIMPRMRGRVTATVNDGRLYVSGGCSATRFIDVYDIANRTWETLLAPGGGRCGHVSMSVGPYVIFAGGYDYWFNPSSGADVLNTATGEWASMRISIHGQFAAEAVSPTHNVAVIAGGRTLGANGTYTDAVDIFRYAPSIGSNFCGPAVLNSSGRSATMSAFGTDVAADSFLTLMASNLPRNQPGFFLASRTQGFVPLAGGSQGNLCLGGNIARFGSKVLNSGTAGSFGTTPDLTSIPTSPPSSVVIGETWKFQAWFRDANPGATSNFTDGLSVTFR